MRLVKQYPQLSMDHGKPFKQAAIAYKYGSKNMSGQKQKNNKKGKKKEVSKFASPSAVKTKSYQESLDPTQNYDMYYSNSMPMPPKSSLPPSNVNISININANFAPQHKD